ncbi:hypothetical protein DFR29_1396 [Tahibacter aquaticus]|uniref:DUF2169 domain-containing protein n=1 Tax=Tahibacter aquaticus TaxID=520092 RepID=A0A4R6YFL0_9GAMM|nr:DUF2169 domain-containing protein [Tahibacter aquaticus]TDR35149.1 hypothetical protein DFR29_1396 [Tahibacter aquaticus]
MTVVVNQSLYPVQGIEQRFYHGNRYHCISAKVALQWDGQGRLRSLPKQLPLLRNDVWHDQEDRSSLRCASELIPYKPATDVLVVGSVRPADGRPTTGWAGALLIGEREKRLRFFGPRYWRHSLLSGWRLSGSEPCSEVALLYENAYGGVSDVSKAHFDDGEFYPANPHGCGFVGRHRPDTAQVYRAAQIEAWDGAITRFGRDEPVGGFGPIPGYFPARAQHMGSWNAQDTAVIPLDMDMRYWNTAPPDQRSAEYLKCGDRISLVGLRPGPPLSLEIPPFEPALVCLFADRHREARRMHLDTVTIDLDQQHLVLRFQQIVAFNVALKQIEVRCAPCKPLSGEVANG